MRIIFTSRLRSAAQTSDGRVTDLYDLCVGSETIKQEADDSQVPAVKYELLRGELQGGVGGYHLGSVWAHCETRRPDQQLESSAERTGVRGFRRL